MGRTPNILKSLSKDQQKAVKTIDGVVQLCSVAGSGKTKVLTHRIAYMIKHKKIKPENILVATFTKKASTEMVERLEKLISKNDINNLTIGTFHSIGYRILKQIYAEMDNPLRDFQLLQGVHLKIFMQQIIKDLNIPFEETLYISKINDLKINAITPDSFIFKFMIDDYDEFDEYLLKVYREYEKRKSREGFIDFNDMLYQVYVLLVENPEILKQYRDKFQYILIDEAQDNNKVQYELIKLLAEPHNNIFLVGDDDQSIYKFRGAVPSEFINFKNDFESIIINLEENYRSLPHIINTANSLIKHNNVRIKKEIKPVRKSNVRKSPLYTVVLDEDREAAVVIGKIKDLIKQGREYDEIVILYRTNAQSRALEDVMIKDGIPYTIFNSISFYERAEIQDVISYIQLAADTSNDSAFKRIINRPNRFLGKAFVNSISDISKIKKIPLYDALRFTKSSSRIEKQVRSFISIISYIQDEIVSSCGVGDLINKIREKIDYDSYITKNNGNEEDNIKIENLNSLVQSGNKYNSVEEFLNYIDLISKCKNDGNNKAVKLATIHKSKGLEFPIVFMIGMSEGLLPHKYALDNNDIDEERRLAYVGITRARDYLFATSPMNYQGKKMSVSRFLSEGNFIKEYAK